MQTSGFIEVKNTTVEVHEWDKYNSGLITSWANGRKGGRPRKPTGNPRVTHGEPGANPAVTDREDGIEKMEKKDVTVARSASPPRARDILFDALAESCGRDPRQMTKADCQACAVALAQIRGVAPNLTPEEIRSRSAQYRKVMPQGSVMTPHALAKNWAACGGFKAPANPAALDGPEGWRDTLRRLYQMDAPYDGSWATLAESARRDVLAGKRLAS